MTLAHQHTPQEVPDLTEELGPEDQSGGQQLASLSTELLTAGKGMAPFRPQARLIRLLGEQLISDESTAILELVKNAYDADAHTVVIRFAASEATTVLEIHDDGDGMDLQTLMRGWLEPATHRKRGGQWKQRTALGRFPLGEKGVGRFAADKLGAHLELITKPRAGSEEVVLQIRWSLFESDAYLDEIENHWEVRAPQIFLNGMHGTLIRITDLRFVWDRRFIQRIRDSLTRLISPNSTTDGFALLLECSDLPDLAGPVTNQLLDQAPYQLQGRVDATGRLHIDNPSPGTSRTVDLRTKMREAFLGADGKLRLPRCGPFSLALHAWDLDAINEPATKINRGMRQTLKQWSGVSIYRDGFRVLPYGERGDDWLELNQRRVNNPTLRLSNNQIIGIVEITQRDNPDLRDRTSREGMIDNPEREDFRYLVLAALACLEEQRFALRHSSDQRASSIEQTEDPVIRLLNQLGTSGKENGNGSTLVELERAYRSTIENHKRREANLLQLAGLGVAAERLIPTLGTTVATTSDVLRRLRYRLAVIAPDDRLVLSTTDRLESLLESLVDQLDILTPLRAGSDKGAEPVDLRAVATDVCQIMYHQLKLANVAVEISEYRRPVLQAQYGHMLQMMLALFDNALYWLSNTPALHPRVLRVHLWSKGLRGGFVVADSGPGITPSQERLIFEPFYSTRREGLGLGLFIVQQLARQYGGDVELRERNPLLSGANISVHFPVS